jgi:transposase
VINAKYGPDPGLKIYSFLSGQYGSFHSSVIGATAGDAPAAYGPPKTLYNRWKRWSDKGVFARMLLELSGQGDNTNTLMIDATHLKGHRTASSLGLKKGDCAVHLGATRPQGADLARRGTLQTSPPDREQLRQPKGLASGRNPL